MASLASISTRLRGNLGNQLLAFVFRGLSVLLGFLISYYVGRTFGAEGSGHYALITQTGMLFSMLVLGGMDFAVVKEYSAAPASGRQAHRGSIWRLVGFIGLSNLGFMLMFAMLPRSLTLEPIGLKPEPIAVALIGAIMLGRSYSRLTAAFLRSQGGNLASQIVELVLIPLIVLAAIAALGFASVETLLIATVAAGACAALLGIERSLNRTATGPDTLRVGVRQLLRAGLPMWGLGVALNLADWYSVAIVSSLGSVADAGVFRMASLVGNMLSFGVAGTMGVFAAHAARLWHNQDRAGLGRAARRTMLLNLAMVGVPAIIISLLAPWILGIIGPEFVAGTDALRLLMIGQLSYAIFSPASQILAITGNANRNLVLVLTTTALFMAGAPLLYLAMGGAGVALAVSLWMLSRNLVQYVMLRRFVGLDCLTGRDLGPAPNPGTDTP